MDRRTKPDRIAEVIRELNADVIALQEVLNVPGKPHFDQARYIARALGGYTWRFGETRPLHGGEYGNMTLSRFPVRFCRNYDVSSGGRERRGCLRVDVNVGGQALVHIFNVHLGTGFLERRHQARLLLSPDLLQHTALTGTRVIVGDFNEWTRGLTSRMMTDNFESIDPAMFLRRSRTYPGLIPFLHLDHFYFDKLLALKDFKLHRSRKALLASDHLPLVADFALPGS
jgi:endonuclease/exonuclease/phosphatase family metal-dependent hydrolase